MQAIRLVILVILVIFHHSSTSIHSNYNIQNILVIFHYTGIQHRLHPPPSGFTAAALARLHQRGGLPQRWPSGQAPPPAAAARPGAQAPRHGGGLPQQAWRRPGLQQQRRGGGIGRRREGRAGAVRSVPPPVSLPSPPVSLCA